MNINVTLGGLDAFGTIPSLMQIPCFSNADFHKWNGEYMKINQISP